VPVVQKPVFSYTCVTIVGVNLFSSSEYIYIPNKTHYKCITENTLYDWVVGRWSNQTTYMDSVTYNDNIPHKYKSKCRRRENSNILKDIKRRISPIRVSSPSMAQVAADILHHYTNRRRCLKLHSAHLVTNQ